MTLPADAFDASTLDRSLIKLTEADSSYLPNFFDDSGDGFDLEDRAALRRVPGLATELDDVTEVEYRQLRLERVVLIGVWTSGSPRSAESSMAELAALATTAGSVVLDALVQRRDRPDAATYVGSGKARELAEVVAATGADTVVCDGELTPGQLRQLEEVVKVKVIDRTALILDIFAQHATSREGKAQVELAQLQYMLPRLRGWGESMSRAAASGGGRAPIGTRGPGETKIETDRRRLRARMARLRRELAAMTTVRETKRSARRRGEVPSVAIAGYTNAGKSSLLNRLTGAGVLVEDALFATLDPTVRRATLPDGRAFTLTDTVGFVRHLPHQIVEAFRSTLEEVADADLILHVVDGSSPEPAAQISAVREVLNDIDAGGVPELIVVNKVDAVEPTVVAGLRQLAPDAVFVSARTGEGLAALVDALCARVPHPDVEMRVLVPYTRGDLVSRVHANGEVLTMEHTETGTRLSARVSSGLAAELHAYRA
ncbi:GTP-binding protein HflX [Frankia casuarinae]|uniref:GTPase HflX n=2 Tax=Frankia casuarinae (strain DSM 45818 / CECT 9043 / HFP020203 / CcI3) TaxID=106370 RepID=Q2J778_FRACC|nr:MULTISPECIES: GTPase HflX [Frankia]ABD12864.1 GTP-binding protein HflX [Frankia casuarinae]ETA03322.1 GTP-binding protein HflX [Frankia sp. CcI6]EYT92714.1 GTP-binding protein HflX [Frankia casuarinae]KDA43649.1 GTP-binding protein HflX [Frankia sp. BMG5.23]OAA25503.1 GTP-binding protein HflX [Frankia casuarinae]